MTTPDEECVTRAMASRVKTEIELAVEFKDKPSRAMDHLDEAKKALDALRYRMWNTYHTSGEVR